MNYIQRAVASVTRKKGKSFILLILVFVLGNLMAGAISIRQSIMVTENALYGRLAPIASIERNPQKINEFYDANPGKDFDYNRDRLGLHGLENIARLPSVKSFEVSVLCDIETKTLSNRIDGADEEGLGPETEYAYFNLRGCQDPEIFDIQYNRIRLVEGRVFCQEEIDHLSYVAVISKDVAQQNGLSVGSMMEMEKRGFSLDYTSSTPETRKYTFEVIGIFEPILQKVDYSGVEDGVVSRMDYELRTTFYMPNAAVSSIEDFLVQSMPNAEDVHQPIRFNHYYILNSIKDLASFRKEASAMLPSEYYMIADTAGNLEMVITPMQQLQHISSLILIGAIAASVLILGLMVTLFVRDRKHELGIYLSLGERKARVIGQIVLEVCVVAMIGITFSLFSGSVVSDAISSKMMQDQIVDASVPGDMHYSSSQLQRAGYEAKVSAEEVLAMYDVSLDGTVVLLYYVIGLGTVLLSTLMPTVYISRIRPKKILM